MTDRQREALPDLECADVRELIANDLDRELTLPMRRRVQAHLAGCEACRSEAETLAGSLVRLRSLPKPETAAPWFAQRTLDRLVQEFGDDSLSLDRGDSGQLELISVPVDE